MPTESAGERLLPHEALYVLRRIPSLPAPVLGLVLLGLHSKVPMNRTEAESIAMRHYLARHGNVHPILSFGSGNDWLLGAIMEAGSRVVVERRVRDNADRRREFHAVGFLPDGRSLHRRGPMEWKHVLHINERAGERRKV